MNRNPPSRRLSPQGLTNIVGATSLTFGFDGLGRLTSADTSENGGYSTNIDRTYNTLGRVETEKQVLDGYNSGNGRTITYVYDDKGMVLSRLYPVSGDTIHYDRDAIDRVNKVSKGSAEIAAYEWSGPRLIKKTYPGSYDTYNYDGYGRLTDIHAIDTSSVHTLDEFIYGFDRSSQITSEDTLYYDDVQNTRITTDNLDLGDQYGYDGAKRLVTALRGVPTAYVNDPIVGNITGSHYLRFGEFVYDQTGNRVTRKDNGSADQTYVHDQANQVSKEGANAISSDKNGNYTGTSNAHKYTWNNQWGRFITSGGSPLTNIWHFDALGRKVQWEGNRTFRYYFDGDQEVEHVEWATGSESARKEYIWGDRIDDLLLYRNQMAPAKDYYAHTDHLGSVASLCDSNGAIQEGYRYLEWGQTTIVDSSFAHITGVDATSKNNVRFAGRDEYTVIGDENNTWYNNRARAYRSSWGRFIERDSRQYADGPNLAVYVQDDPVRHRDPFGLQSSGSVGKKPPPGPPGSVTISPGYYGFPMHPLPVSAYFGAFTAIITTVPTVVCSDCACSPGPILNNITGSATTCTVESIVPTYTLLVPPPPGCPAAFCVSYTYVLKCCMQIEWWPDYCFRVTGDVPQTCPSGSSP